MVWMNVKQYMARHEPLTDNLINVDTISRVVRKEKGCYLKFVDGTSIEVEDSFEEIAQVFLKAQGK